MPNQPLKSGSSHKREQDASVNQIGARQADADLGGPETARTTDAGEELALGLAEDRRERVQRAERVRRGIARAGRLEAWGGRLLTFGGIAFYVLFAAVVLTGPLFGVGISTRTWLLVFGADCAAIVLGGFCVFLAQRINQWLMRWAEENHVEVF